MLSPSDSLKMEIKYASQRMRQTNEVLTDFIKHNCLRTDEFDAYFESEFKIFLYPSEYTHIKYRIICAETDESTIDLNDPEVYSRFTGWICNEKQHRTYMNAFMSGWYKHGILFMDELEEIPRVRYYEDGNSMESDVFDVEYGLYLHGMQ